MSLPDAEWMPRCKVGYVTHAFVRDGSSGVIIPAGDEAANNTVTAVGAVGDIYGAEAVSYAEIEARFFVFLGLRRSFVRRRDEDANTQQPGAPDRTKPSLCVCCVSVPRRPITVSSTRRAASNPPARARARSRRALDGARSARWLNAIYVSVLNLW